MASLIVRRCFTLLACLTMLQVYLGSSYSVANVQLDLYYESLCPDSAKFIINELPLIFLNGIIDIVDLQFFPWGNAKLASNKSFICQHGPKECFLNTVEACAIHTWPNVDDHFPFISCVESQAYKGKYNEWDECFKELGLDPKPVTSCYKGEDGKKLELKYANLTAALKPPHEFVPWVVVDGKPLKDDYGMFISYICKAYKGTPPSACKNASSASALKEKSSHVRPVATENKVQSCRF